MPGRDGAGPDGMGPMTGRGRGVCTGNVKSGYRPFTGLYGSGGGWNNSSRCIRRNFLRRAFSLSLYNDDVFTKEYRLKTLKEEAEVLRLSLDRISRKIGEIEQQ